MTRIPDSHRDLLETQVSTLATIDPDGRPQVTAVWFLLDDDDLVKLSLNTKRYKVKYLQARPECTFFVLDPETGMRSIEIRATAEIEADPDYEFANKLGKKYNADIRLFDAPDDERVAVTLHPVKINVLDMG